MSQLKPDPQARKRRAIGRSLIALFAALAVLLVANSAAFASDPDGNTPVVPAGKKPAGASAKALTNTPGNLQTGSAPSGNSASVASNGVSAQTAAAPISDGDFANNVASEWADACFKQQLTAGWVPLPPPGYICTGWPAVPCQAHHIIPQNYTGGSGVYFPRYYLIVAGLDINGTYNGVFLTAAYHQTLNNLNYYNYQGQYFLNLANLVGANTQAGARYYTALYLNQSKHNLLVDGGCISYAVPAG